MEGVTLLVALFIYNFTRCFGINLAIISLLVMQERGLSADLLALFLVFFLMLAEIFRYVLVPGSQDSVFKGRNQFKYSRKYLLLFF